MKQNFCKIILLSAFLCIGASLTAQQVPRPRTIITTDGEVDDADSFIRLLLYSNDLNIEGIVYSSSQHHWAGDGKGSLLKPLNRVSMPGFPVQEPKEEISHRWIGTSWVQEIIADYAQCYPNLIKHDKRYPTPESLYSLVKIGNIEVEGDMRNPTEGSEWIKNIILDDNPDKVYLEAWGGTNTIARALLSIEEEYKSTPKWNDIYQKVSEKAVIHIIQDQDGTYRNYVAKNWPNIKVIYNRLQFFCFAYLWNTIVPEPLQKYLKGDWMLQNIKEGHGPLAAHYYCLGEGYDLHDPDDHFGEPEAPERMQQQLHNFISEGDSPSYFVLLDFGLRNINHPDWGGLGGRYVSSSQHPNVFFDPQLPGGAGRLWGPKREEQEPATEKVKFDRSQGDYNPYTDEVDMFYPQSRWVGVLQNDFAARADWCVKDYIAANHSPSVTVEGSLDIQTAAGTTISLKASATDPDGNQLSYKWWQYREAGNSDLIIKITNKNSPVTTIELPDDAPLGASFHLILEVSDNGTPSLTRFQRVIITIK